MPRLSDLIDKEQIARLQAKIQALTNRVGTVSQMQATQDKRFRVGVFVTPLTVLGAQVTGNLLWSSPMPSDTYKVDAGISIQGTNMAYTVTNQTADGCTVSFNAPVLLAAGTIVVVLAVSPAT